MNSPRFLWVIYNWTWAVNSGAIPKTEMHVV
jgi:hypothetical protein